MQQYIELLNAIIRRGTKKAAARENMPHTVSLFGYQFRHELDKGFPLLTTKKIKFKNIVTELLWFLRGDTNIKYLIDNGFNLWNEDAYNYYKSKCTAQAIPAMSFDAFVKLIKEAKSVDELTWDLKNYSYIEVQQMPKDYVIGECGFQYGRVWRRWQAYEVVNETSLGGVQAIPYQIDQIKNLIDSLRSNPEGRRHILTAIDPAHDKDLALYWCHSLVQFNCRPIEYFEGDDMCYGEQGKWYRWVIKPISYNQGDYSWVPVGATSKEEILADDVKYPKYYLDCQMYQRSADVILGVPYNIASYALLTHILAVACNMQPGDYIHTFGDVHIYSNHKDAVLTQLQRSPKKLPKLSIPEDAKAQLRRFGLNYPESFAPTDFTVEDYDPRPAIKAELSTGLKQHNGTTEEGK